MVSGAGWLFFFVAFWYWTAGLSSVLLVQVVTNITFSGPEFGVAVKPSKIIQLGFLFFCHVRHPSGNEQGQTVCHPRIHHPEAVPLAGFAVALGETAVAAKDWNCHPSCHQPDQSS